MESDRLSRDSQFEQAEHIFKMLANQNRLRLMLAIAERHELSVTDLASTLGTSLQVVSNQLRLLENGNILRSRRQGKAILYSVADATVLQLLRAAGLKFTVNEHMQ